MAKAPWKLTPFECFEAPAVTALFYHNSYEEGKQGGFEIIQQGTRLAGNGNLRLGPAPEQWAGLPKHGDRQVTSGGKCLSVACEYPNQDIRYTVHLQPDGNALRLRLDLEHPIPEEWAGRAGFNLELMPGALMGKTYFLDATSGIFPRQFYSQMTKEAGVLAPIPLARGKRLVITPEYPQTHLEIEAVTGELILMDGRARAQNGWFIVHSLVNTGATTGAVEWRIQPHIAPGWQRKPVIAFSQVGYHPRQKKQAVIELDPQVRQPDEARLMRLDPGGSSDPEQRSSVVEKAQLSPWGKYLHYQYAIFDFSAVTEPGMYFIEYEDQVSETFPIHEAVYQKDVWQPTLEYFLPIQMCHVEVREGYRLWHGICHLDDALQAPLDHKHFDGYVQQDGHDEKHPTETLYFPLQHIPYLNIGGWHDAGDYDLAAGSQARTTLALAYVREIFGLDSDQTTVQKDLRKVILHIPDGIPDIVQQVAHGVENLLSGYRAAGHSFSGIIENSIESYVFLGDPGMMTDNHIDDEVPGGPSSDDRWAFTNRDTALEYLVCAALAASSRVLRGFEDDLAEECLQTSRKIWAFEQTHPVKTARSSYVPGKPEIQEIVAASELLITTGEAQYRKRLLEKFALILENVGWIGWAAARALPWIEEEAFRNQLGEAIKIYAQQVAKEASQSPFGIPYPAETWRKQAPVWGIAWNLQQRAVELYFLWRAFPDFVDPDPILAVLGYVLGCHPVSNASLVSGVGAKSLTAAYGTNRADWTHIPGGVVSGPALIRPNYPELLDPFPFLWMQKEYVISGAANYIFLVLAADNLLNP